MQLVELVSVLARLTFLENLLIGKKKYPLSTLSGVCIGQVRFEIL